MASTPGADLGSGGGRAPNIECSSSRLTAEIRYGVAQDAENDRAVLAREALLERREPAAHGVERRADRPGGNDAVDADRRGRLLARTGSRAGARPAGCR